MSKQIECALQVYAIVLLDFNGCVLSLHCSDDATPELL